MNETTDTNAPAPSNAAQWLGTVQAGDQPNTSRAELANDPALQHRQLDVEDEAVLRELKATTANELAPTEGSIISDGDERRSQEPICPESILNERDRKALARAYLGEAICLLCHGFITGWIDNPNAWRRLEQFEEVVARLGGTTRREMLDSLDRHMSRELGDEWEVFKSFFNEGFWTWPADPAAVLRVARAIPADLSPQEADRYGPEYLDILREARQKAAEREPHQDWQREGF